MLNVCENRLLLTLINNNGVTKEYMTPPATDPNAALFLFVTYTGEETIAEAVDLKSGRSYPAVENMIKITLEPGRIAVLEFKMEV